MLDADVNRLPVIKHGRLIGIVTRADLVRAIARSDEDIARDVRQQVALLEGLADQDGRIASVPGVVTVRSELSWAEDV